MYIIKRPLLSELDGVQVIANDDGAMEETIKRYLRACADQRM